MTFNAHIIVDIHTFVFVFAFEFVCDSAFVVMMITIMMTIMLIVDMDMACQNIPTMTKSHHGGEMSIMIKVGMCQTSTSQSSFPSSTRCQVLCMRGQLRHALWAGKWRGRYLHPCNKNRGKGDPALIINFLLIIYFNSKHSCPSTSRLLSSFMVPRLRNWTKTAL